MKIYDAIREVTGVVCWENEEEYRQAEKFLVDLGASRVPPSGAVDVNADFYLENRHKFDAFTKFARLVEQSRSIIGGPPNLQMDIYTADIGVQMMVAWANEDEYQLGRKFLVDIGALEFPSDDARGTKPDFFHLQNEQQLDALLRFRKSLRDKRG